MNKVIERTEQNTISVRNTSNGYYEARISLKIGGVGKSDRLQKGGKKQELAVLHLLEEIETFIDSIIQNGLINFKINSNLPQLLIKSINNLQITNPEVTEKTLLIVNKINNFNSKFDNVITLNNNIVPFPIQQNNIVNVPVTAPLLNNICSNQMLETKREIGNTTLDKIEDIGVKWKTYELELCVKTQDNPNPLSQKTVDGYIDIWNEIILPFLTKQKKLYINQIDEKVIKDLITSINYYDGKRLTHITLNEYFKYLKKEEKISFNIMEKIDKPVKPIKDEEDEIICIEPENQNIYLDMFEEENTDMSLLFETMLLTGIRPEEACGLKWCALKFHFNKEGEKEYELIINNAYKDFKVYDENKNPIGHERRDDRLKTPESYRTIPLNTKFAERLLEHKEKQKEKFNKSIKLKRRDRRWAGDKEYMFLGRKYNPYVSETLSSALPKLCDKYKLERYSPYALRHSFATFCFENGMKELTLMKVMGHASFETTHKYYIRVSKKVKQREMEEVFKDVFYDRWTERKAS